MNIHRLQCQNQEINITLDHCDTSNGTVITSSARFIVSTHTTGLTCGDAWRMSINKTKTISVQRKQRTVCSFLYMF